MYVYGGTATFTDCEIHSNTATYYVRPRPTPHSMAPMEAHEVEGVDRNFPVYSKILRHCQELIAHNTGSSARTEYTT